MLTFIDETETGHDLEVWRCQNCKSQFELKRIDKEDEPKFCPYCGESA